jgi:flap endonuclease-1
MGVKSFYQIIEEICPYILQNKHLNDFCGYIIGVDISIFFYKTVRSVGENGWLDEFLTLLLFLFKSGIKLIFIFDGPNPPKEKVSEQLRRRAETKKIFEKLKIFQNVIKKVKKYVDTLEDFPEDFKNELKKLLKSRSEKINTIDYDQPLDVYQFMLSKIEYFKNATLEITDVHKNKAKELLSCLGLTYIQADGEAEGLCASLAIEGHIDGVLTEDTDVLAYLDAAAMKGVPLFLAKLNIYSGTVRCIMHINICRGLDLTPYEVRDLCILLGCDYNKRVKGFPFDGKKRKKYVSIGPKFAYPLIKEFSTLEKVEERLEDADPLIYRRCREIFTSELPDLIPNFFESKLNELFIENFLKNNKMKYKIENIRKYWLPPKIVYVDEEIEV